ncbi:branched-chain amino acid ABC transporter permease [Microvirga brassicacearum]|uniref:Branched-chain amino acid ABC transporter permease n=1 Tax=Microvirga brassicacearum TaxID=2580413 RepID=A0A5N3PFA4_9HYPH|nr:branched-chain amino acid ABC transporter permease [Microvirga brassicacearum]KAB0268422.1 branched-chain amino acid ABC transporter permease [Microvirga brassicacearum]
MFSMPLPLFAEQIINGIVLGSMYALVASGLTLIWGTMRMLNFAHGEFYMLGGYFFFLLISSLGLPPALAVPLAISLVFLIGLAVQRLAVHPLLGRPQWEFSTLVATLGVSIFLQNAALHIWGERFKTVPYFINGTIDIVGMRLSYQRLLILAVAVVAMLAMWYLLRRTRFGMALRATAMDRDAAMLYGVNVYRVFTITFGIAAALAGLAATMLASINSISPWMGAPLMLKGFVVVVLGGLGSFPGAIVGGIIIGIVETLGVITWSSQWREVISFTVLILILWFRPWGLFGVKES